jgi:hypothetical protein
VGGGITGADQPNLHVRYSLSQSGYGCEIIGVYFKLSRFDIDGDKLAFVLQTQLRQYPCLVGRRAEAGELFPRQAAPLFGHFLDPLNYIDT